MSIHTNATANTGAHHTQVGVRPELKMSFDRVSFMDARSSRHDRPTTPALFFLDDGHGIEVDRAEDYGRIRRVEPSPRPIKGSPLPRQRDVRW